MKRIHVNLSVRDLNRSVAFYKNLFGTEPTRLEDDYAKWLLDEPAINLSLVARGAAPGIDHLGIMSDDEEEVALLHDRVAPAIPAPEATTCCYSESTKSWLVDPDGVRWENFVTHAATEGFFGEREAPAATNCCGPDAACC